ncbi:hypothetical protein ACIGB8_05920 [Promicromonospora sukumoe]|uniref:hypothetical protein n=1 Tax=Promicromonospora sukumoe TaxID=88382 RepID=UPI0037C81599
MVNPRLELALEKLGPGDWRYFEKFASEFLASDFPAMRTTASSSGDGGRDAEVFRLDEMPKTVFQYSVTANWKDKIKDTIKKIQKSAPEANRLIYCTSQEIGAQIDELRESIWDEHSIQVDLRDRNWFIEREADSTPRRTASEELAQMIVEPFLKKRNIIDQIATPITQDESKVALLQLALNDSDKRSDQSLTKTSFDALVQAALVETSAESTRTKGEVCSAVERMLATSKPQQVRALTISALTRLSKKRGPIKHIRGEDRYHLSYESANAWQAGAAEFLLEKEELERDLSAALFGINEELDESPEALAEEAQRLRFGLERLLLHSGESFANSIAHGSLADIATREVSENLASYELGFRVRTEQAATAIITVLSMPSDRTRNYLGRILNAYTLLAFLQQTPDVQKVLSKVFDGGEIWLDTSAVLPLIAETAFETDDEKPFTELFTAARDSGLKLYVTLGVIEEISHHLSNCLLCVKLGADWRDRIPYVLSAYMSSGRAEEDLAEWVAEFRGKQRPELDIEESLKAYFGIERRDLTEHSDGADIALRGAVQKLWIESHSKRRQGATVAIGTVDRLTEHDVENVVGVVEYRKQNQTSPLGYTAWLLTLDRTAFTLQAWLNDQLGEDAPHSPVISPDYFSQMLRFGPLRRKPETQDISPLPVTIEIRRFENVPHELMKIASETRQKYAGFSEVRIRREVRDALDHARIATASSQASLSAAIDDQLMDSEP